MSENVNGGLAFAATLDINDFKVSSEAMERRIRSVSDTAVQESERMEQSIAAFAQNGARYIIGTLVGGGMMGLVNSIVQTRGQFQQLQIAFDTMLGSGAKSKALMDQLTNTAAKTPFDLMGVAGGAKQLLAYGSSADKVNDTLVRLGNIASGLSIPLNDIVYLYGTTMVQGRLYAQDVRQFTGRGIPLVRELAAMYGKTAEEINTMVSEGKIGFPEVEKVINKMTDSGGQFYNLMERQSKSLTGMISNLGDSWDMALNKLGEQNQGILESGISGAITVVEHLDDVLSIVKAIAIAYGSYRAAIVLNTLATKGNTGISLIDNTVRQAKIALMKAEATLSGEDVIIKKKMEQAEKDYVKSLQEKITLEQHEQALSQIRTEAVNDLLTAEQKRYLSNKGLTSSSKEYLQEAESVLSAEQKMVLSRQNLDVNGRKYADTIADMAKKNESHVKALESEAKEISKQIPILEESKRSALQNLEIARAENLQAQSSTSAKRKLTAERNLAVQQQRVETITTELNTASKRKEAIQTELNTIASRKNTAAGVTDVVTKTAQTGATNILTLATTGLKNAVSALWASMKANPLGWIVSLLGIAYSAYDMFFKKQEDGTETITGLAKATKDASEEFDKQAAKVDTLQKIVSDGNIAYFQRNKALDELKQIIPGYHAQLTKEGKLINDNTEAIQVYLTQLEKQIKLKAAQDELEAAYKKKRTLEKTESTQSDKYWDVRQTNTLQGYNRNSVTAKASRLLGKLNDKNTVTDYLVPDFLIEKEDQAHRALSKTQSDLKDVNNTITELNNEISSTSQSMNESTGSVRSYSQQITDAQKQVSTLKNELKELRSGKVAKADLAAEIESKTKELKDAETKLSTLTGKNTPTAKGENEAANKAQQLAEKQIQAELKAEQSRIDIMEDGYEKRKALEDLEHKKNLAQIDKEKNDLIKARREAGKGGLSAKEVQGFDSMKSNEDARHAKAQNQLFDGEIEYKKSQYELYWRWVKNMGDDVAKERFKDLLKSGDSYKTYLENEIQKLTVDDGSKLTDRKGKTGLSEGEVNYLSNLKAQMREVTGEKSALDQFKDSFTQAISRASTLAEKLKVIADFQDRLENGKSNLLGADDKAAGNLIVSQQKDETDNQVQEKILSDFKTYEEKRLSIKKEYALLREQAIKDGNTAAITEINKGESEKISALFTENLMASDDWKQLFGNLDNLTVSKMIELRDKLESSWSQIELSPEALNDLRNKINEVTNTIQEKNPFQALLDAIKRYKKESSKVNFTELMKSTSAAIGATKEVFDSVVSGIKTMGIEMDENTENMLNDIGGVLDGASQLATGIATGNPLAIIQGSVSLISNGLSLLDSGSDRRNKRLQEEIEYYNKLVEVYDTLIDKQKELTESFTGKEAFQAYLDGLGLINAKTVAARNSLESWFSKGASMFSHSNWYKYDKDMGNVLSRQKLLSMSAEEWTAFMRDNAEQWAKLPDEVKTYAQAVIDAGADTEELAKIMKEALVGFSLDDASNSIMELASQAELTFKSISGSFSKLMQDAILRLVKSKIVDTALSSWYTNFAKFMEDGVLSADELKASQEEYQKIVKDANDYYKAATQAAGVSTDTSSEDPLSGAVKSMSEETAGIVAGRLNAVIINQSDGLSLLRQSLLVHQQIAANTAYCKKLEDIDATLKQMQSSGGGSLLSRGIS